MYTQKEWGNIGGSKKQREGERMSEKEEEASAASTKPPAKPYQDAL
jgi:hypothetical protein